MSEIVLVLEMIKNSLCFLVYLTMMCYDYCLCNVKLEDVDYDASCSRMEEMTVLRLKSSSRIRLEVPRKYAKNISQDERYSS